jgi:hypothetical protein
MQRYGGGRGGSAADEVDKWERGLEQRPMYSHGHGHGHGHGKSSSNKYDLDDEWRRSARDEARAHQSNGRHGQKKSSKGPKEHQFAVVDVDGNVIDKDAFKRDLDKADERWVPKAMREAGAGAGVSVPESDTASSVNTDGADAGAPEGEADDDDPATVAAAAAAAAEAERLRKEQAEIDSVLTVLRSKLNKLTSATVDKFSNELAVLINGCATSVSDSGAETLFERVCELVYDKASRDITFSGLYATLSSRIRTEMGDKGEQFKRHLIRVCQHHYKVFHNDTNRKAGASSEGNGNLNSDAAPSMTKAAVRGMARFIGELFKVKIMPVQAVLAVLDLQVVNPDEDDMEALLQLMTSIGKDLDTIDSKYDANLKAVYKELMAYRKGDKGNLPKRVQFLVQDLFDLRSRKWQPKQQR